MPAVAGSRRIVDKFSLLSRVLGSGPRMTEREVPAITEEGGARRIMHNDDAIH
jgi:hypothetical protein